MRSGTSFFNLTIYRKTLQRYWPLMAVNFVVWFIVFPLSALTRWPEDVYSTGFVRFVSRTILDACGDAPYLTIGFGAVMGLLTAMAICSHLYHNRSANFMAALPIRREGQFISTYLAGLTMLVIPNVVNFLLMVIIEATAGHLVMAPIAYWLMYQSALNFFFFSFAVCIGMFAGHILALPVYFGVFNAIVGGAYLLFAWIMEAFYFGYYNVGGWAEALVVWLTPVVALARVRMTGIPFEKASSGVINMDPNSLGSYGYEGDYSPVPYYAGYETEGGITLLVYVIAALVLVACALLLYRKRRMESAGDAVAVRAMRPVFRYGVAICMGVCLGLLTAVILDGSELSVMIWMLIWGVIGAFVAQMFLDKSLRVFKKWKGAVGTAVFFLLMFAVIGFDLTGYESRVPDPARVESVRIEGLGAFDGAYTWGLDNAVSEDPQVIANAVALHQSIVDDRDHHPNTHSTWVTLRYTMTDGSVLARNYNSVDLFGERLAYAQAIVDERELLRQSYEFDRLEEGDFYPTGAWLSGTTGDSVHFEQELSEVDHQRVLDALVADFEAGNIGVRTLGVKEDQIRPQLHLSFEFRNRKPSVYKTDEPGMMATSYDYLSINIGVLPQSVNTIAALRACEKLVPEAEVALYELTEETPPEREKTLEEILAGVE